jgi:hypothetical protein
MLLETFFELVLANPYKLEVSDIKNHALGGIIEPRLLKPISLAPLVVVVTVSSLELLNSLSSPRKVG